MKILPILLVCAAAIALLPAEAQGRRSSRAASGSATAAKSAEEAEPSTGVRFAICSPGGISMPSPLYVQAGKTFKPIQIGSRTPSMRVRPVGGVIKFWDKDPTPVSMDDKGKKAAAPAPKDLPEPIFSVTVPADVANKAICILSPSKEIKKTQAIFLDEKAFPRKGMHVINLSSYPLQILTSETGDFKDKKESPVGVYQRENGICESNSWSFKGEKGQKVSFVLSYMEKGAKTYKRLKASTFVISGAQSMINIVVKDPTRNVPKLMPLQIAEGKKSK